MDDFHVRVENKTDRHVSIRLRRLVLPSPPWLLLLFGLSLYLLTTGAYLDNPDGRSAYSVTRGLALRGSIAIPPEEHLDTLFEKVGRDGVVYSKYGVVQPILQLPLFLAGRWLDPLNERRTTETAVSLLPAILTALTLPLLYRLTYQLYSSKQVALVLSLIYGGTTMAWLYATLTYTEPLLTLLLLAVVSLLFRADRTASSTVRTSACCLAGVLAGIAILTKYPAVIYVPALVWYVWQMKQRKYAAVMAFVGPLLLGVLCLASYNHFRFGDVLNTGYHIQELTRLPRPLWYGLYTVLLSPGKSVFIYAPPLLLALFTFHHFVSKYWSFAWLLIFLVCSSLMFYAVVNPWAGAWSPGPRYHLPVLPLALLPLGSLLLKWDWLPGWKRVMTISLLTLGVLVQVTVVSISYTDTLAVLQAITDGRYEWGFWFYDLAYAPIRWQGRLFASALERLINGRSALPEADLVASTAGLGVPIDWINCWVARVPPQARGSWLIAGGLCLVLIATGRHLVLSFLDRHAPYREQPATCQE